MNVLLWMTAQLQRTVLGDLPTIDLRVHSHPSSPDPHPDPCPVLLFTTVSSSSWALHLMWWMWMCWFGLVLLGEFCCHKWPWAPSVSACPHLQPSSQEVSRGEQPWHFSCHPLPAHSSQALLCLSDQSYHIPVLCCGLQPWLECAFSPWLVAHIISISSSSHNLALLLSECIHMQVAFASVRVQVVAAVAWLLQFQAWPSASCTCLSSTRHHSVLQHPWLCPIRPPLAIPTLVIPHFLSWFLESTLLSPKQTFPGLATQLVLLCCQLACFTSVPHSLTPDMDFTGVVCERSGPWSPAGKSDGNKCSQLSRNWCQLPDTESFTAL